ncbi:leucine-rich repeat protein [Faecalibacterium prausnitzii]|uniref:leucine-rich repeat protein n=1 Tax=Faecalibacterium prausnitzii TaxID=853 RepID=UPI001EDD34F7|nr:leucine-rich repeat protein [Faecalibacterium prausnitzii]MCG4602926.1 leucine-rich repeat protein [Faecalibacterium prausnitzii]
MRPKRLISLLVAVCMMITMLPLSAVTAFAADTSTVRTAIVDGYKYEYTINTEDDTATIKYFRGPVDSEGNVDSANNGPYDIDIPSELDHHPVTGLGAYSFSGYASASPYPHNSYQIGRNIRSVDIPQSVTSIGDVAFGCCKFTTLSLGENIETIGGGAFWHCSNLSEITIPENVKEIKNGYSENIYYRKTFEGCSHLKCIILPAGFKSFEASLRDCPTDCVIYYNNDWDHAKDLLADNDNSWYLYNDNGKLKNRNFLYLCKVTFDANGGDLTGNLTNYLTDNLTDHAEVPVYTTEKITETIANDLNATDLDAINAPKRAGYKFIGWYTTEDGKPEDGKFDVKETAITDDITLYARWEFDPNALDCHPLTVTGGTVTVKYDGSDVTSELRSTDAATGQKTYSVPDGAEVTVTLDKNLIPKGNVFDSWSTDKFSLPQDQDHKAETITFPMNSDADIAAEYRDAATDHTPDTDTAVCHPLTVTGGIVTVKKGDKDVTDTLTVTTDETTGKKTYSVPDGAEVTVKLDKTLIPEGMVFDIWSTGKFSLPLGQDYKAETITFTMSSDADIAAQYRDATIEDDGPNVLGTAAIIGTAAVGTAVLGYQAYSLGAEFAGKLMALPYFPSNRSALAMMLWEDAGKPMPESELLYPDVGQEEQDMDLQHAARWAMENELIPDLNDEGTAPEEMKFFPANPVSKLDVLNAWQKAQELKNN